MFDNLIGRTVTTYASGVQTGSTTARYVFDGTNMVLAFDGNGNLTDRYLQGPAVDQVLADENYNPGSGTNPSSPGTTLWALGDNQNSVRDVVNDSGTLEEHIAYSPFGQQVQALTTTGSVLANFAFGYTGTYTDPVTGFQLHGVRWYDPASQRWLSRDPAGLAPDSNPYRYCGNDAMNFIDPSGLDVVLYLSPVATVHNNIPVGNHVVIVAGPDSNGNYVQFDGGGIDSHDPDPAVYNRPLPTRKVIPSLPTNLGRAYKVCKGRHKTSAEELAALNAAFEAMWQLPYSRLGPNSNTYAKQLLSNAGFTVTPITETRVVQLGNIADSADVEVGPTAQIGWSDASYGGPGSEYNAYGGHKRN